jgi:outer membrane protein assembly factor BamB
LLRAFVTGSALFATATLLTAAITPQASAAEPISFSSPHIVAHLNLAAGQQPENITLEPDGSADLTFAFTGQIARVSPNGKVRILGTVPAPPAGTVVPLLGHAFVGGIVRAPGGILYFVYTAGTADLTGVWKLTPGGSPHRIAALPADALPNGLAMDDGFLYTADSNKDTVWRVPLRGGTAVAWSSAAELVAPAGGFGPNGLKVHHGAVWVTNTARGTLLRIPITDDGAAGRVRTVATGLGAIDDFTFIGEGDTALVAANPASMVELVRPDGTHIVVLTMADGLQNPTSLAWRGHTVYVASAAYFTATDPNLLTVHIGR